MIIPADIIAHYHGLYGKECRVRPWGAPQGHDINVLVRPSPQADRLKANWVAEASSPDGPCGWRLVSEAPYSDEEEHRDRIDRLGLGHLTPGTYVLTRDVANPKPDRRRKRSYFSRPEWKKGDMFVLKLFSRGMPSLEVTDFRLRDSLSLLEDSEPVWRPLVGALAPKAPDTLAMVLREVRELCHADAEDILKMLVDQGHVTLGQVAGAGRAYDGMDEAACDALNTRQGF